MATFRLPILGASARPTGVAYQEPYPVKATNDTWKHLIFNFPSGSTRDAIYGTFEVPQNYASAGTTAVVIVWTSQQTTGDVEWDFDYRAVTGDDSESLDQATAQEAVNANDTAPGATDRRMETSITLTAGNFAAGDTVEYGLFRDQTDAGDTIAGAVQLFGVYFSYTDG